MRRDGVQSLDDFVDEDDPKRYEPTQKQATPIRRSAKFGSTFPSQEQPARNAKGSKERMIKSGHR